MVGFWQPGFATWTEFRGPGRQVAVFPCRCFFVALAAEDARCQPQCIDLSARFLGWYDELEAAGSSSSKNLADDSLYMPLYIGDYRNP